MIKIAIFCKTLLKGGAEKQALTLSKLLTENKTEVILINWCADMIDPVNSEYIRSNSIRYIGFNGNPLTKLARLFRIIKEERISVLISYLTLANFITGICRIFHSDLLTIGGIRNEKLPFHKFVFEMIVHNYMNDITVFNNFSAKNKFEKRGFKTSKIVVIHNAIHVPVLQNSRQQGETVKIVTVSRFVRQKDFGTALHSIKALVNNHPDKKIKYYIVGYGPLENEIRSLVKQLGLTNEVEILINPPNIAEILKTCDIYLSTSLFEGLSNSIMEAMVSGLPIVATDIGDNHFLIRDEYNGFKVPCRDAGYTADKLGYLVNSEKARVQFGKNSHDLIKNEFSEEKLLENYLELFSTISLPEK
jgi:glycosyltransferase involved in cell wall biosynthesis